MFNSSVAHCHDLFPETLLVRLENGQPMTDSVTVARFFEKSHRHVLRDIRRTVERLGEPTSGLSSISDYEGRRLNFESTTYITEQGKRLPMYMLTKKGFFFVAHKFTGPKAERWQWAFLDAFEDLERVLAARTQRFALALDMVRPALRPVVEGTEQGLSRANIAAPLGKSNSSISYHRRAARRLGLLRKGKWA